MAALAAGGDELDAGVEALPLDGLALELLPLDGLALELLPLDGLPLAALALRGSVRVVPLVP